MSRTAELTRETRETRVHARLHLDGLQCLSRSQSPFDAITHSRRVKPVIHHQLVADARPEVSQRIALEMQPAFADLGIQISVFFFALVHQALEIAFGNGEFLLDLGDIP